MQPDRHWREETQMMANLGGSCCQNPHPTFDHGTREAEISAWKEWSWTFEQHLSSVDSKFLDDIEQVRAHPERLVDPVDFTESE